MRTLYDLQKRWLAFLLAAAMVLTNAGTGINTVYAADSAETVAFTMDGTKLLNAVRESIVSDNQVSVSDLDFTNGKVAEFESMFFGEGKLMEVFPEPEGGSVDVELRVFIRVVAQVCCALLYAAQTVWQSRVWETVLSLGWG